MYLWRQSEGRSWRIYWWDSGKIKSTSTGTTDRMDAERVLLAMKEAKQGRADERRIETLLRAAFAGRGPRGLTLDAVAAEYLEAAPKTPVTNGSRFPPPCTLASPGLAWCGHDQER